MGDKSVHWRGGRSVRKGYVYVTVAGERLLEHVLIAEKALGHPLPELAVVHHHDRNPLNNANSNLVICEDQSYHQLLHRIGTALGIYPKRKTFIMRGSSHTRSKLNEEQIIEIRRIYDASEMPQRLIAEKFGVCETTIWLIGERQTWRHV